MGQDTDKPVACDEAGRRERATSVVTTSFATSRRRESRPVHPLRLLQAVRGGILARRPEFIAINPVLPKRTSRATQVRAVAC